MKTLGFKHNLNKLIKAVSVTLILALILSTTGCGAEDMESAITGDAVFTFDGEEVSLGEVYIYANTVAQQYESAYGGDIWRMNIHLDEENIYNMEDITRRDIIQDIVRVKMLNSKANEYEVALTEYEENEVIANASVFFRNLTDAQIKDMEMSQELVEKVLRENAIASKVYDEVLEESGIEVSDEDARKTTFYDLFFECYAVASSGDVIKFSEDEWEAQEKRAQQAYDSLINPVSGIAANGGSSVTMNIEGLSEYYGLTNSAYHTMSPEDIADIYGEEIKNEIYNLDDGSFSLVTRSEYGYHIFYVKALTDREATDANKELILKDRQSEYLDNLFNDWQKKIDPEFSYERRVNQDLYSKITL